MHGSLPQDTGNGGLAAPPISDDRMDQVREILFGDYKRDCERQIAALEARLGEVQAALTSRLAGLEERLEALAKETQSGQKAAFADLAHNVGELGERIRALSQG